VPRLVNKLMRSAALSRTYLDKGSRSEIAHFIRSRWNKDGGVRGRDERSDMYYTVFAVICLHSLGRRFPYFRLWKYVRSFGAGESLDLIHLFCLIRLRSLFPMSGKRRNQFVTAIGNKKPESAYDMFFKVVMAEYLGGDHLPEIHLSINPSDPTTNIAAAVVVNQQPDLEAEQTLMDRYCKTGGFCAGASVVVPDLLSTATTLFALTTMNVNLDSIRQPCFEFVESLWRDSGGFAGHASDQFEDPEYTYYALLSIGCLME
jgi:prenyltransferase beta subunit